MVLPIQKQLLDAVLRQEDLPELLRLLDPSQCPEAEQNYWHEWHENSEEIRFSHSRVSAEFLHGDHRRQPLERLITELVGNPMLARELPPLVAVKLEGILYVIMGNRRLKCLKEAWNRGARCWFRIIVHAFPECDTITDTATRCAFYLKSLQAATSQNLGVDVEMHPKKRQRCW